MNLSLIGVGWLDHVAALSRHRYASWVLAAIAFADSSFLPVPPDILLVPMVLFRPERLRALLVVCTLGSALGAVFGYLIGYALWTTVGAPLVEFYGYMDGFLAYQRIVAEWGFWIIIVKAFTPIPFKIAAIAAGVGAMDPMLFMLAAVVGRALHFAMVGVLLVLFGERLMALIARYQRRVVVVSVVVVVTAVVVYGLR